MKSDETRVSETREILDALYEGRITEEEALNKIAVAILTEDRPA